MISLLYFCALRVTELTKIRVEDINLNNATLTIWESKNQKDPALVPIPATLLKMLNQWITENKLSKTKYLFTSNRNKKLSRSRIHVIIKIAAERSKVEKEITTHTFRRTRATHLLDAGLPLEKVNQLLRHKHLSSTMVYLKISIKGLQREINKIDKQDNDLPF